ncbi:hypothetical protein ACPXCP_35550 [Streptomyces sp. DT20]|uniref:hypothetical protein n=1 Tax=Streptomyces sp. DT20 TaxID=3416519 RepID=UPI003CED5CB0
MLLCNGNGNGNGKANANALANLPDAPVWTLFGMLVPVTVLPEWPRPVSGDR